MKRFIYLKITILLLSILLIGCNNKPKPIPSPSHSEHIDETSNTDETYNPDETSNPLDIDKDDKDKDDKDDKDYTKEEEKDKKEENNIVTLKLSAIGDVMSHYTQILDAYDEDTGEYDYSNSLKYIKKYTNTSDLLIANLETVMTSGEYTGYPMFNTPPALAHNLKDIGVDIVSMANNHSLDRGFVGLVDTIDNVELAGLEHVGTYKDEQERQDTHGVLYKQVNGISMVFLNYTYGTNVIRVPEGKEFCINLLYEDYLDNYSILNKQQILEDLEYAKSLNPDLIIGLIHWGNEYVTVENQRQRDAAQFLFENGVDIIIGNHSHVLQPMEQKSFILPDESEKDVFVCYSLGNFMSNITRTHYTLTTAVLNIYIEKDLESNETTIKYYDYVPVYMLTPEWGGSRFYVLPIHDMLNLNEIVDERIYEDLIQSLKICHDILGKEYDYYYIRHD